MFRFTGRLGQRQFGFAVVIRLILLATTILTYPTILTAFVAMSGCRSTSGACGAVGLLYGLIGYASRSFGGGT